MRFFKNSLIALSFFLLIGCKPTYHLATIKTGYTTISDSMSAGDAGMDSLLVPYRKVLDAQMNEIVGHTSELMGKAKPESKLTNLLADILREAAETANGQKVDFAILNYGGIRLPTLPKGEITMGKLYELCPFDNQLVVVKLDGSQVIQMMGMIASSGGWPVSKELRLEISKKKPVNITINNVPIDNKKQYLVAMPDYVANGGDNFSFLTNSIQVATGIYLRDAIIDYFKNLEKQNIPVTSTVDGRIKEI